MVQRFRHPVAQLEGALRVYEDYFCLLSRMSSLERDQSGGLTSAGKSAALANWYKLRSFLLSIHRREEQIVDDILEYVAPTSFMQAIQNKGEYFFLYTLPLYLAAWSMKSRRVYKLSRDVQKLLELTSLEGVTWQDLILPFECFAIELSDSLTNPLGLKSDFILVSQSEVTSLSSTGNDIYLIGLQEDLKDYKRQLHYEDEQSIASSCSSKQNRKEQASLRKIYKHIPRPDAYRTVVPGGKLDSPLSKVPLLASNLGSAEQVHDDRVLRIVFGFSLYLKSLPSNSECISGSERKIFLSGKDGSVITDPAEVLAVNAVSPLTRDEKIYLGLEGSDRERKELQMSCHWRAGHWRRPPGKGSDPNAAKTVHVRPTLVRKDRLPDVGLPGGAIKGV